MTSSSGVSCRLEDEAAARGPIRIVGRVGVAAAAAAAAALVPLPSRVMLLLGLMRILPDERVALGAIQANFAGVSVCEQYESAQNARNWSTQQTGVVFLNRAPRKS